MILGPQGPGKVSRCQVVQETIDYDGLFALGQITHQCVIWRQAFKFSWVGVLAFFRKEKTYRRGSIRLQFRLLLLLYSQAMSAAGFSEQENALLH